MKSWWRCLEEMDAEGVEAQWQARTGADYAVFRGAFLTRTEKWSGRFPSRHFCGCGLRVVRHGDGSIVGVSDCDTIGCENVGLTEADIRLWALNWVKLGRAVARALDCETKDVGASSGPPFDAGTRQVAAFGAAGLPVVLTIQRSRAWFGHVVARLVATLKERFILLAPTSRHLDANAHALLAGAKAGFLSLESQLTLLPNGTLQSARRGGELFAPYLPEQRAELMETEATRVFRLFGGLFALGTKMTKAPPARVFDLMVFQKRSKAETAVACECAASLITRRVVLIEKHFQMPIEKLLAFASDLQERRRTVKGDGYAKKKHGAISDTPNQYEDDDQPTSLEEEDGYHPDERPDSS